MTLPRLASRLAEKWARYLEFLRASLEHEPDGPQAWRWEIKARVLTYLLARYGSNPTVGGVPRQPYPDSPATTPLQRTFIPPRPRELFTARLQRIAEANDLPPEEQSRLADDLNRRSPPSPWDLDRRSLLRPTDETFGLALLLWVLLGVTAGALVVVVHPQSPIGFACAAAVCVWAVGILGGRWLVRRWRKTRRP